MAGFKNERQLWKWMKPQLEGSWKRVEAVTPEGLPDCMGRWGEFRPWIELKVSDRVSAESLEPSQRDMIPWLDTPHTPVYVAFGSTKAKSVLWVRCLNFSATSVPSFWKGESPLVIEGAVRNFVPGWTNWRVI